MNVRFINALALAVAGWGVSAPTASATCIGLNCSCEVVATNLAFGAIQPFDLVDVESTADIEVTCSATLLGALIAYDVSLGAGGGGSYANRRLASGPNTLAYELYTDLAHSSVWGDGAGGTVVVSDSYTLALAPTTRSYVVYGVVPSNPLAVPGDYADIVIVTVTY